MEEKQRNGVSDSNSHLADDTIQLNMVGQGMTNVLILLRSSKVYMLYGSAIISIEFLNCLPHR